VKLSRIEEQDDYSDNPDDDDTDVRITNFKWYNHIQIIYSINAIVKFTNSHIQCYLVSPKYYFLQLSV